MTASRALIDTGAIYAFVTRTDRHHEEAKDFVRNWLGHGGNFLLADLVFAEIMTLLKARLGAAIALRVGRELRRNPVYCWHAIGAEAERDVWAVFERYQDKEWSYTDSAILTLARREKVAQVFAFDRHFSQMPGIERLPGT